MPFDGHRLEHEHRGRQREAAAEQAGHHHLAALGQRAGGEAERLLGADEIAGREHAAAGGFDHGAARLAVGRIEGRGGAGLERRLALAGIDVGDDRRLRKQRARDAEPHHADAAEPDQQRGPRAAWAPGA